MAVRPKDDSDVSNSKSAGDEEGGGDETAGGEDGSDDNDDVDEQVETVEEEEEEEGLSMRRTSSSSQMSSEGEENIADWSMYRTAYARMRNQVMVNPADSSLNPSDICCSTLYIDVCHGDGVHSRSLFVGSC
jgi:hypothetical protein